jgi:DNA modification methylase
MTDKLNKIHCGDSLEVLKTLPDNSVDCCVTSPPYFNLRNYFADGQIGQENTLHGYITRLADIFTEVYRVLKPSGTFWLNLGDTYGGSGNGTNDYKAVERGSISSYIKGKQGEPSKDRATKTKSLCGVPFRVAFALQERGWILRQDIIWHKPNPMPESVTDRCTKAHEYIFLLTKSPKYYFNHAAMLEPAKYDNRKDFTRKPGKKYLQNSTGIATQGLAKGGYRWKNSANGQFMRNRRSVWSVPTRGFKGAHFATFPKELIRPCIAAGCPEKGIVLDCFMGAGTTALVARELGKNYI